ncbi:Lrp/AsnC family transcriptional regulator [Microbacterium sp. NPDC055903]
MATENPSVAEIDEIDRRIIALLRRDGRMSNAALAEAAGVAASTCLARVRGLRERGVITGFAAHVDHRALGLGLEALIGVRIRAGARHQMASFMTELAQVPGVVQVFFLGGDEDFLVHVAVRDSDAVREFVLDHLSAHPAVAGTRTSLILDHEVPAPSL